MKRSLKWIGGEHEFSLDISALRALQAACNAGPEQILRRIARGDWMIDDLYQTIRLGLVTGGMAAADAADRLTALFASHPAMLFRPTAQMILTAALMGVDDDPLGESEGATRPPENGSSAPSTATER